MQIDLNGRTALITGSDRNTGAVIAARFADSSAHVVIHSNQSGGTAAASESLPGAFAVEGDIATATGCDAVLAQLQEAQLQPDILINNYGTASLAHWEDSSEAQWLDMYQKNVLSTVRLIQGLTPAMRARGWGRIVNLGTIGSHRPNAIMPHYYSAKGALATLGVSLTQALADSGITVNTVSPGLIRTPELEAGYRARAAKKGWGEDWDTIEANIVAEDFPNACGRLATREEVADLVLFLASENAGFINGQNIRIDGGAVVYV